MSTQSIFLLWLLWWLSGLLMTVQCWRREHDLHLADFVEFSLFSAVIGIFSGIAMHGAVPAVPAPKRVPSKPRILLSARTTSRGPG